MNERLVLGGIRSRANGRKWVSAAAVLGADADHFKPFTVVAMNGCLSETMSFSQTGAIDLIGERGCCDFEVGGSTVLAKLID